MRKKQNIFGNECFLLNCYSLTSFFSRKNSKNVLQDSYSLVIQPNANLGTVVEGLYRWTEVANQKKEIILVDSTELHKPWEQRTMEEELVRRKGRKKMRKKGKLKTLETMSRPLLLSLKMRESWCRGEKHPPSSHQGELGSSVPQPHGNKFWQLLTGVWKPIYSYNSERNRPRDLDFIPVKPGAESQMSHTVPRHGRSDIRVQITDLSVAKSVVIGYTHFHKLLQM